MSTIASVVLLDSVDDFMYHHYYQPLVTSFSRLEKVLNYLISLGMESHLFDWKELHAVCKR